MSKIYLACPYTHKRRLVQDKRFDTANKVAAKLMDRGHIVFSPISHSVPIDDYIEHGDHEFWLNQDKCFLDAMDELYVLCLEGWEYSYGIAWEIKYMRKQNKLVTLIDENLNELFPN